MAQSDHSERSCHGSTNCLWQHASFSFSDFPEDVQLCVLSFLSLREISSFALTSRRFNALCRNDSKLWFSICDRRWGRQTQIKKWGLGKITFKCLYSILVQWENLIGFWRRSGHDASLVFFEWGPFFVTGSLISPCKSGGYRVSKIPFVWVGLSATGVPISYILPDHPFDVGRLMNESELPDIDVVPVNVNFVGKDHFVIEETSYIETGKMGFRRSEECSKTLDAAYLENLSPGSPPDQLMSEIYRYFANRTSPGCERLTRRQRKKEKGKNGWRKFEAEHYVKIVNFLPAPSRPLQGLWKGIGEDGGLNFYLVSYDDIGGIACRKVGNSFDSMSGFYPVFWTSNATFIERPFPMEECDVYEGRVHIQSHSSSHRIDCIEAVSRILRINSSYELVIRDLSSSMADPRHVEGRIWQYEDGTFGFGFLRNNYIIDVKHVVLDEHLLDVDCHLDAI